MHKWMKSGSAVLIALAIAGCASNGTDVKPTTTDLTPPQETTTATITETAPEPTPAPVTIDPNNPLLAEWTGP